VLGIFGVFVASHRLQAQEPDAEKGVAPTTAADGRSAALRAAVRRIAAANAASIDIAAADAARFTDSVVDASAAATLGSIVGTVHDAAGAVLPGTDLRITSLASDETQHRTADGSGAFTVGKLTPGSYEIRAEKSGFRGATATIVLAASYPTRTGANAICWQNPAGYS
jgi:hypothetical protein